MQMSLQHFGVQAMPSPSSELPPAAVRELMDAKQRQVVARLLALRRMQLAAAQVGCGLIARSCLRDVCAAVAAALPGVSVEATMNSSETEAHAQAEALRKLQRQQQKEAQRRNRQQFFAFARSEEEARTCFVLPPPPAPAAAGLRICWE